MKRFSECKMLDEAKLTPHHAALENAGYQKIYSILNTHGYRKRSDTKSRIQTDHVRVNYKTGAWRHHVETSVKFKTKHGHQLGDLPSEKIIARGKTPSSLQKHIQESSTRGKENI